MVNPEDDFFWRFPVLIRLTVPSLPLRGSSRSWTLRGSAKRKRSTWTSASRTSWRRSWRTTASTSTRGKRFSSWRRRSLRKNLSSWRLSLLPARHGSLPDQRGAHPGVLRQTLHHQQSLHGQRALPPPAERHAEQLATAHSPREEVGLLCDHFF